MNNIYWKKLNMALKTTKWAVGLMKHHPTVLKVSRKMAKLCNACTTACAALYISTNQGTSNLCCQLWYLCFRLTRTHYHLFCSSHSFSSTLLPKKKLRGLLGRNLYTNKLDRQRSLQFFSVWQILFRNSDYLSPYY